MSNSLFLLGALGLLFAAVFLVLLAVAKPKQREDVEARLKRLASDGRAPAAVDDGTPKKKDALADISAQLDEVLRPMVEPRLTEEQAAALAKVIGNAGRYTMTPLELRLWQVKAALCAPLGFGIFLFALMGFNLAVTPLLMLVAALIGYQYPLIALNQEATARRNKILRQLPTMLDLLTICVEAGLSLQAAMVKVLEKSRPSPLRDELDHALREIQLGRPRAEALKEMGRRINLKEVNSVVLAMVQAEAMGTSVGKALRVQADIARENRWTRAQELAFKAPVKLTFPLVFFIFPTIFIVIFGPVALELLTNWLG